MVLQLYLIFLFSKLRKQYVYSVSLFNVSNDACTVISLFPKILNVLILKLVPILDTLPISLF